MAPGAAVSTMLTELQRALHGPGAALTPVGPGTAPSDLSALGVDEPIDDDVALVVATSGTTGTPNGAVLTGAALVASANASHDRLGGPGHWLLALPAHHIAGIQVLVRSLMADTTPVLLDVATGFDADQLPTAVASLGSGRRYTSLVATQLAKALALPPATAALAELDAVLLGGGPAPQPILNAATEAGVRVVCTYGMSETAGGCVYDGVPLTDTRLRIRDDGRIAISGPMLARGYRKPVTPDPFSEPGWFVTNDLGALDSSGRLTALGRADDAISTGGLTVLPGPVEEALSTHPAVAECAVFGITDERLGQRVAVAVVSAGATPPDLETLRAHVGASLDLTAAPREMHIVSALPRRGIGKIDRKALVRKFTP